MNCTRHRLLIIIYNFYFYLPSPAVPFMGCMSEHMHVWAEHMQPQNVGNDLFTHTSVSDLVDQFNFNA